MTDLDQIRSRIETAQHLQEVINAEGLGDPDTRKIVDLELEAVALKTQLIEERELKERWRRHGSRLRDQNLELCRIILFLSQEETVSLDEARRLWQSWKDAWGTGDSEEAYALMEMDTLLGVDDKGNVVG